MMLQLLTPVSRLVNFPSGISLCGEAVSREAHNLEVEGANPSRANLIVRYRRTAKNVNGLRPLRTPACCFDQRAGVLLLEWMKMPSRIEVEIGSVFGRLTIVRELLKSERLPTMANYRYFECVCVCGETRIVGWAKLRSGSTQSCGCYNRDVNSSRNLGRRDTPVEYKAWQAIKQRCYNEHCRAYPDYGGRGIKMCDRWINSFDAFLEDMGKCPVGHTIERSDNNGDYCPDNCVWATRQTQSRNTRRNRLITFQGTTMCLTAWAEALGINLGTLTKRLKTWPIERALTSQISQRHITNRKGH